MFFKYIQLLTEFLAFGWQCQSLGRGMDFTNRFKSEYCSNARYLVTFANTRDGGSGASDECNSSNVECK